MKKTVISLLFAAITTFYVGIFNEAPAQENTDSTENGRLTIAGYGQIDFNKPLSAEFKNNASLDVHRMVFLLGYQYNSKLSFLTEIELEHVSEVYVEQAYLNYSILPSLNFKAGLVLIPMGIINEFHEPPTYNGVERPIVDTKIVPTTWREIGFGFTGNILQANINYQLYIVNGFTSFNGSATLNGSDALRKGRQKGAESFMSHPNLSAKVSYNAIHSLEIGLSGYFGKTQSTLYNGIDKNDAFSMAQADSSVVNVSMLGFDYRFSKSWLRSRGQAVYSKIGNTQEYNAFTEKDLGSALLGYYGEASVVIPLSFVNQKHELEPFVRWEHYNTHFKTHVGLEKNKAYIYNGLSIGVGYRFNPNTILKADYLAYKKGNSTSNLSILNLGVGVSF